MSSHEYTILEQDKLIERLEGALSFSLLTMVCAAGIDKDDIEGLQLIPGYFRLALNMLARAEHRDGERQLRADIPEDQVAKQISIDLVVNRVLKAIYANKEEED